MKKVYTKIELPVGALFGILGNKKTIYGLDEEVQLWHYKDDSNKEIIYAKGVITSVPKNFNGSYECEVMDLV